MGGHAVLGPLVHGVGADLQLHRLAARPDHSRVQRLVHVELRLGDPVLEAPGYRVPAGVQDAEHGIAVADALDENSDAELLRAQMENLALEVQRSLDYFESQYALGPADRLSVMVDSDAQFEAFARVAGTFLTVQTERFSLAGMATSENVDPGSLDHGITAVGAAMRGLPRAA